jgi:hypothetical protein
MNTAAERDWFLDLPALPPWYPPVAVLSPAP